MNIVVGIDTSSTDLGIGIYRDGKPLASYSRYIGNSHAEHLTPLLSTLLSANDIPPHAVRRIAVAEGPGSFTGLRIGIAFVKGFSAGAGARIMPVSSMAVLAHAARAVPADIVSVIDARNGDLFTARFRSNGSSIERLTADAIVNQEEFIGSIADNCIIISDTLGYARSTAFTALPGRCRHLPVEAYPLQRGLVCASIGVSSIDNENLWLHHTEIHPNYLRRSTPELRREQEGGTTK